jgi:hypothetical protein
VIAQTHPKPRDGFGGLRETVRRMTSVAVNGSMSLFERPAPPKWSDPAQAAEAIPWLLVALRNQAIFGIFCCHSAVPTLPSFLCRPPASIPSFPIISHQSQPISINFSVSPQFLSILGHSFLSRACLVLRVLVLVLGQPE